MTRMLKRCSLWSAAIDRLCDVTQTDLIASVHSERVFQPRTDWHQHPCNVARNLSQVIWASSSHWWTVAHCIADDLIIAIRTLPPADLRNCRLTSNNHVHWCRRTIWNINIQQTLTACLNGQNLWHFYDTIMTLLWPIIWKLWKLVKEISK